MSTGETKECLVCDAFTAHKAFCAAGGSFFLPPLSNAEVEVLRFARNEIGCDRRTWIFETLLQQLKRYGLVYLQQNWDALRNDLALPVIDCQTQEPKRSAATVVLLNRLPAHHELPPGSPDIPVTLWHYISTGVLPFVVESFAPVFASRPNPSLWTEAAEYLKQATLACALARAWARGACDRAPAYLAFDRAKAMFEQLDVAPRFREHHLRLLQNWKGCLTSDGPCECSYH